MRFAFLALTALLSLATTAQTAPIDLYHQTRVYSSSSSSSFKFGNKKRTTTTTTTFVQTRFGREYDNDSSRLFIPLFKRAKEIQIDLPNESNDIHQIIDQVDKSLSEHESERISEEDRFHKTIQAFKDAGYTLQNGRKPVKFSSAIKVATVIGLGATLINVMNNWVGYQNIVTAIRTFSAHPTPPTLIDTAGRWHDGQLETIPLPSDKPPTTSTSNAAANRRQDKFQVPQPNGQVLAQLRKRSVAEENGDNHGSVHQPPQQQQQQQHLEKRGLLAGITIGGIIGLFFSPGFTELIKQSQLPDTSAKMGSSWAGGPALKSGKLSPEQVAQINQQAALEGAGPLAQQPPTTSFYSPPPPPPVTPVGTSSTGQGLMKRSVSSSSSSSPLDSSSSQHRPHVKLEKRLGMAGAGAGTKISPKDWSIETTLLLATSATITAMLLGHSVQTLVKEKKHPPVDQQVNYINGFERVYGSSGVVAGIPGQQALYPQPIPYSSTNANSAGFGGQVKTPMIKRSLSEEDKKESVTMTKRGLGLSTYIPLAFFGAVLGIGSILINVPRDVSKEQAQVMGEVKNMEQQMHVAQANQPNPAGAGVGSPFTAAPGSIPAFGGLPSSSTPMTVGGGPLHKRSTSNNNNNDPSPSSDRLNKRGAEVAMVAGGLSVFMGNILGDLLVSMAQRKKGIPYVTPDPNAKGPVPILRDQYGHPVYLPQYGPESQMGLVDASANVILGQGSSSSMYNPSVGQLSKRDHQESDKLQKRSLQILPSSLGSNFIKQTPAIETSLEKPVTSSSILPSPGSGSESEKVTTITTKLPLWVQDVRYQQASKKLQEMLAQRMNKTTWRNYANAMGIFGGTLMMLPFASLIR